MAGHGVDDDPSLKGISRYFNSQTNRGRANTVSFSILCLPYMFTVSVYWLNRLLILATFGLDGLMTILCLPYMFTVQQPNRL
ncbi:hypothetical protein ABMA27_011983 [Loxostege sticticalis]|uniref:Uncharacterized protein n=1 Tax=Loxostege sticticalis TaxID=481309 RepID=A0ABR3II86_LOXSC